MVRKYVGFRTLKRGVLKPDGSRRTCMHCNKLATVVATKVLDKRMEVWFCEAHAKQAKCLG